MLSPKLMANGKTTPYMMSYLFQSLEKIYFLFEQQQEKEQKSYYTTKESVSLITHLLWQHAQVKGQISIFLTSPDEPINCGYTGEPSDQSSVSSPSSFSTSLLSKTTAAPIITWHHRLGHLNTATIKRMESLGAADGLLIS